MFHRHVVQIPLSDNQCKFQAGVFLEFLDFFNLGLPRKSAHEKMVLPIFVGHLENVTPIVDRGLFNKAS
jgi:hypothetical protein